MARPKANKKAAKSGKPAKARGGAVKKAASSVKKAASKKKTAVKSVAKKTVKSAARSKPAAKKSVKSNKTVKKASKAVKKVAGKKAAPAAKKKVAAKKSAASKKAVVKKTTAAGKRKPMASTKAAAPAKRSAKKPVAPKPAAKAVVAKKPASKKTRSRKSVAAEPPAPPKTVMTPVLQKIAKAVSKSRKIGKTLVRTQAAAAQAPQSLRSSSGRGRKPGKPLDPSKIPTEAQLRKAPDSHYMNDIQLAFFQQRLMQMRGEVLAREIDVKERLHQREIFADPADRASAEEEHWLDLRLRERESLLLKKIDEALRRIRDKEYGYCEKTGEPIGIARLLARPTATVCVDVKGQNERAESQYRDR